MSENIIPLSNFPDFSEQDERIRQLSEFDTLVQTLFVSDSQIEDNSPPSTLELDQFAERVDILWKFKRESKLDKFGICLESVMMELLKSDEDTKILYIGLAEQETSVNIIWEPEEDTPRVIAYTGEEISYVETQFNKESLAAANILLKDITQTLEEGNYIDVESLE